MEVWSSPRSFCIQQKLFGSFSLFFKPWWKGIFLLLCCSWVCKVASDSAIFRSSQQSLHPWCQLCFWWKWCFTWESPRIGLNPFIKHFYIFFFPFNLVFHVLTFFNSIPWDKSSSWLYFWFHPTCLIPLEIVVLTYTINLPLISQYGTLVALHQFFSRTQDHQSLPSNSHHLFVFWVLYTLDISLHGVAFSFT